MYVCIGGGGGGSREGEKKGDIEDIWNAELSSFSVFLRKVQGCVCLRKKGEGGGFFKSSFLGLLWLFTFPSLRRPPREYEDGGWGECFPFLLWPIGISFLFSLFVL